MSEKRTPPASEELLLDCETPHSTAQSLARLFSCSLQSLTALLSDPAVMAYYEQNCHRLVDFPEYLIQVVEKHFGYPTEPDGICWFHTTRVAPGTTFEEGILPLGSVMPRLQQTLVDQVDDAEAREILSKALSKRVIPDFHFQNKTTNSVHWGPYAILVRDVAFHSNQLSQHDYLGMPEIIEDICFGLEKSTGLKLLPIFQQKLRPTIVKFVNRDGDDGYLCIPTALCYLRECILHGQPESMNSVYCFDGEGRPVPPADIIKIEYL